MDSLGWSAKVTTAKGLTWICSRVPAVMLEMVQHASLRMPFFGLLSSASSRVSAEQLITCCVWLSSPVTMLPAVRNAGVCTEAGGWPISSTMRMQMPVSSTAWIFSLGPSERYDSAQHASASTCGRHGDGFRGHIRVARCALGQRGACASCGHLVIVGEDELSENRERGRDHLPHGLRLAAAQVGKRPRCVAQHRHLCNGGGGHAKGGSRAGSGGWTRGLGNGVRGGSPWSWAAVAREAG